MASSVSSSLLLVLGVLLLSRDIKSSSSEPVHPDPANEQAQEDYPRFAEVERHCRPVLSSAAVLADDPDRAGFVKRWLSFEKGDWSQAAGSAPLMPFDGGDAPDARRRPPPLSLATFMLTHVGQGKYGGQTTAVNVSGVLFLSVSRKSRDSDIWPREPADPVTLPEFRISPGEPKLRIVLEGVYTERSAGGSDEKAEVERVLCMVGRAHLPTRSTGADPWEWARDSNRSGFVPRVAAEDSILLVLRYPKEPSLTNRAVLGEMRSTSVESAAGHFDPVQLVSRLWWYPLHRARSEGLISGACSPPLPAIEAEDVESRQRFKVRFLCEVLSRYAGGGTVLAVRSSKRYCDSAAASCPFEMDQAAADADGAVAGVKILVMQDLQCDETGEAGIERVSAVFRAVPPLEDPYTAARRSGLSGMTLSAEGVWNASAGQACMVACRGIGDDACHFRVCMYVPMTLSITRRSVLVGRITSTDAPATSAARASVSFQSGLSLPRYWGWDGERLAFTYNYTKVMPARDALRRGEPGFDVRKIFFSVMPLLLRYPEADYASNGDRTTSLAYLADELTLRFTTTPRMFQPEWIEQAALNLEIIFLDQVSDRNGIMMRKDVAKASRVASEGPCSPEGQTLINVSAELTAVADPGVTVWVMSLEGVYNPRDGRMHLIGCRDVRLPRRNLSVHGDLEEGMDCSVEVRVEYPPTSTHEFVWSTAKVHVASRRGAGDPLRFDTMKLQAVPTAYRRPRPDNVTRGIADGVLCIVILSAATAAAVSQLRHLKAHADVAPHVSLVMLGVQALGFAVPLATDIQALLAKPTLRSHDIVAMPTSSSTLNRMSPVYRSVHIVVSFFCVAAFFLTLWLVQKVRRSRARVPGDAKVLVYHCGVHLALFVLILAVNGRAMTMEQDVGLMQDLFLLPQVIGNAVWRVNCKPLAEGYYLLVTAVRLLPHVYEYVRPPPLVALSHGEYVKGSRSEFFPGTGDLVMPALAVLLGFVVYVQQRWNYAIVRRMGVAEQGKWQHTI